MNKNIAVVFRISVVLLTTAAGFIWLNGKAPVLVLRGSTQLPIVTPAWYMLSAFPILGMLLADWGTLLISRPQLLPIAELGIQLIVLVLVSSLRLDSHIPISGHILLFTYFLLRRFLIRLPIQPLMQIENGIAVALFIVTSYVKLVWWTDIITWAAGIAGGLVLVLASWIVVRYTVSARMHQVSMIK